MLPFLRLVLLASLASLSFSCSADDPAASGPPSGDPTGRSGDGVDAGPCVALGCDELGYKCGITVDNCGNELNCEQGPGLGCQLPDRCGGDPDLGAHMCGCKPRANPCDGQCGTVDECGTIVECGACRAGPWHRQQVRVHAVLTCQGARAARCPRLRRPVSCGPQGASARPALATRAAGSCRPRRRRARARWDRTTRMPAATSARHLHRGDNAAACEGAECGARATVRRHGLVRQLRGTSRCVSPQFVRDERCTRLRELSGGYCVAAGAAKMLGHYP